MQPSSNKEKKRCAWVTENPLYIDYHDHEWGVPVYDDRLLFEFLVLEGMQAGLSWLTILKKRENYRQCFDFFQAEKIVNYQPEKIHALLLDEGIIRNKLKIQSIITNANAFLRTKAEWGTFSDYIWQFTQGKPIKNDWQYSTQVPTNSEISDRLSKDLKRRGFKFIGGTICYAFMQAVGMVNDHTVDCFRYIALSN